MAFQFNAILDFKSDKAIAAMGKAQAGFSQFKDGVGKANASFGQMMGGVQGGAVALAPLTGGLIYAIKSAADFEQGLTKVQATMLASKEEMKPLALVAKQLGAATKFSAVEATEGALFFAQAGFDMQQTIAALPGAMDAAAASGATLAQTADIMSSTIMGFGLEAKDAAMMADVLALGSSLTNTDMIGLGEGLKMVSGSARTVGMSVQDTVSALGVLSNAGLKGTMAGTALTNMFVQLAKPSKETLQLFNGKDGFNAALKDSTGKLLPMEVMMANMSKVVAGAADPLEAAGRAAEFMGLRGAAAYNAFAGQMQGTTVVTDIMLERFKKAGVNIEAEGIAIGTVIPTLVALRYQLNGAAGAAGQMADIQMQSLVENFGQLGGAVNALGIELGELKLGSLTDGTKMATAGIGLLALGFQALSMNEEEFNKLQGKVNDKNDKMFNQFGEFLPLMKEFAGGFKEGIGGVIEGLKEGFVAVKEFFGGFSESGMTAKEIGKMVAQVVLVGAILAPVLAGIAAFAFVMAPLVSGVVGFFGFIGNLFTMIGGAWGMIVGVAEVIGLVFGIGTTAVLGIAAAILGLGILIYVFREEIAGFFISLWGFVSEGAVSMYNDFMEVLRAFAPFVDQTVNELLGYFSYLGTGVAEMFMFALDNVIAFGATVANFFTSTFLTAYDSVAGMVENMYGLLKSFGAFMLDIFLTPIRMMMQGLTQVISQIASFIPNSVLEKIGLSQENLQGFINSPMLKVPTFSDAFSSSGEMDQANKIAKDNSQLSQSVLTQKTLVQPPSADDISSVMNSQSSQSQSTEKGGGQQTVKVIVEGRIRGNDLNLAMTRSQVEQSQLNGRSVDPIAKRRAVSNGAQFGGE